MTQHHRATFDPKEMPDMPHMDTIHIQRNPHVPKPKMTPEREYILCEQAFGLRARGKTYRQMAALLGISVSAAYARSQTFMIAENEHYEHFPSDTRAECESLLRQTVGPVVADAQLGNLASFRALVSYSNTMLKWSKVPNPSRRKLCRRIERLKKYMDEQDPDLSPTRQKQAEQAAKEAGEQTGDCPRDYPRAEPGAMGQQAENTPENARRTSGEQNQQPVAEQQVAAENTKSAPSSSKRPGSGGGSAGINVVLMMILLATVALACRAWAGYPSLRVVESQDQGSATTMCNSASCHCLKAAYTAQEPTHAAPSRFSSSAVQAASKALKSYDFSYENLNLQLRQALLGGRMVMARYLKQKLASFKQWHDQPCPTSRGLHHTTCSLNSARPGSGRSHTSTVYIDCKDHCEHSGLQRPQNGVSAGKGGSLALHKKPVGSATCAALLPCLRPPVSFVSREEETELGSLPWNRGMDRGTEAPKLGATSSLLTRTDPMRTTATSILLLLTLSLPSAQGAPVKMPEKHSDRPVLKTIYASTHSLKDFKRDGTKALAIVFVCEHCPVVQQYMPRLREMYDKYHPLGVEFIAVLPNRGTNIAEMATFAHDTDTPFPVLEDVDHKLADLLEAKVTPEVVVLDATWEKRYQGAIDNQFTKRGRLREPSQNYLRDALDAVLADKPVETADTHPSGCPIERQKPKKVTRQVTYYRDIAPIFQANCQGCHRKGEVGPFSLMTYDDAYDNATRIAEVIGERRMPPWHGNLNPDFGHLRNDKRMSDEDISTVMDWVAQDAPAGDKADAPKPIQWPARADWAIGKPDFVYKMPEPFKVPKSGVLEYQFFRVKLNFPKDRWFQAIEIKPGNPEVVHHVSLHLVPAGNKEYVGFAGMTALYGLNAGRATLINDYVPGDTYNAKVYPAGQAVRIPAGSDLVFEVHYTPNNKAATLDQSMVAFRWANQPPQEEVLTSVFRKPIGRFQIPPQHPHFRAEDSYYFEHDVLVDAIRPHFHLRGKSFRVDMIERDPKSEEVVSRKTVLTVPLYDPDWQRTYELATPLLVKAGTELAVTGHFDNSWLNPNNPDPTATVIWGQQFYDEMFSTRFKYRLANPNVSPSAPRLAPAETAGLRSLLPQ